MDAVRRAARQEGTTVSAWVRAALRRARLGSDRSQLGPRLALLREAMGYNHPIGDSEQLNAEIESGYHEDHEA